MSDAERQAFLADRYVGVISVERPNGPPLTVPVWYADTRTGTTRPERWWSTDDAKLGATGAPAR